MDWVHGLARRTDDLVFDLIFQPLVDRFWRAPPGDVARLALGGAIGLQMMRAVVAHYEGRLKAELAVGLGLSLALGMILYGASFWHGPARAGRNPRRADAFLLMARVLGLVTLVLLPVVQLPWVLRLGLEVWIALAGNVLLVASLYLEGCDLPPPPAREGARLDGPLRAGLGSAGRTGG